MKAQQDENVLLTTGNKCTGSADGEVSKPVKERTFDLFPHPDFDIPADFDELPEDYAALFR